MPIEDAVTKGVIKKARAISLVMEAYMLKVEKRTGQQLKNRI